MTLHLSQVSDTYFSKLFGGPSQKPSEVKAKVLLVDRFTTPVISMCYSQSQLLQKDVILIEMIDQTRSKSMKHLECIVYIKPTVESVRLLIRELRHPHFSNYQLFFNNTVHKNQLEEIAEADELEVVVLAIEIFQDYWIVNDNLFNLALPEMGSNFVMEESNSLCSLLLSMKKCPIIKYESKFIDLKRLGSEILYNINSNSRNNLFDDLNKDSDTPPLLLLLDRKSDPITPLITPWTYQSMIHELIGINKNIVQTGEAKEQIILSESQDSFFRESMYLNYGDLTDKFQKYVEEYKKQTKQSSADNLKTQSLSELKKTLTKFPEFKKLLNNILKHLNIISELDDQINKRDLWEISELQQTIACSLENQQTIRTRILEILNRVNISTDSKVKLILLYSVKFSNVKEDLLTFANKLSDPTKTNPVATVSQQNLINSFHKLYSVSKGTSSNNNTNNIGSIFNGKKININSLFGGQNNKNSTSNNIYMQYIPKLNETLNEIINPGNRTSTSLFASMIPDAVSKQYGKVGDSVQDIIIYVKGGVTYEEARLVHDIHLSNERVNLLIGGDRTLNTSQWLDTLYDQANETTTGQTTTGNNAVRAKQLRDIL